ncbi:MAG: FAD/FMN-dependent dehydrogenase [Acidimicrobiaceae bacterium]|nr:FAD/FMN-dependent dehydrogenase [Acidimicrobiaceae bacterium]
MGWGGRTPGVATVRAPRSEEDVARELASGEAMIARGLGRSYGDAAQLSGGVVLASRRLSHVGPVVDGVVSVGAGTSFDELLSNTLPQGWMVPVTPGTRQVSVGGAVAADVHGKNHHLDGSLAHHVRSLRLVTPQGTLRVSPHEEAELFWATMGGMGLTGVVTSVELNLTRVETNQMVVDTERFDDLESVMSEMRLRDHDYRYSVAWVDCMTTKGRSILTRARHARADEVEHPRLESPRPARISVPVRAPSGLLNGWSVRAFNELWYRRTPRLDVGAITPLGSFFHPLDSVGEWNRLYGRRGFVQYQFCVPGENSGAIAQVIERLAHSKLSSFLGVLKRFGSANPAPMSFPLAGWTLALDLPVGSQNLPPLLDELDRMVVEANGRVYLAKDSRLRPEYLPLMYPRLDEFLRVKSSVDPRGQLTSDLARRLGLVGG